LPAAVGSLSAAEVDKPYRGTAMSKAFLSNEVSVDHLLPALRLALVPGVGPRLRRALLTQFETPEAVLAAPPSELRKVPGIGSKLSQVIARANESIDPSAEIELCRQHHIQLVAEGYEPYPRVLRDLADPPAVLFMQGTL
jgi:DNA processing protein